MDSKVKEQILAIREMGITNMFDVLKVCQLAKNMGFYDLVLYLEYNRAGYVKFILTGESE